LHHRRQAGKDIWQYSFYIKKAQQLCQPVKGRIKLSVPVAGIHQRYFTIYLRFGKKTIKKSPAVMQALNNADSGNSQAMPAAAADNASGNNSGDAAPVSAAASSNGQKPASTTNSQQPQNGSPTQSAMPKSSTHQSLASIPLKNYPFWQSILAYLAAALLMILGTAYWRRRLLKKGKQNEQEA
jgi:hypothetical protein